MLVDTLSNLLAVFVHPAGWSEAEGGAWLLFERTSHLIALVVVWADQTDRSDLVDEARDLRHLELTIVERPPAQRGFFLLPQR